MKDSKITLSLAAKDSRTNESDSALIDVIDHKSNILDHFTESDCIEYFGASEILSSIGANAVSEWLSLNKE